MGCKKNCKCPKRKNIMIVALDNPEEFDDFTKNLSEELKANYAFYSLIIERNSGACGLTSFFLSKVRKSALKAKRKYKYVDFFYTSPNTDEVAQLGQNRLCFRNFYSNITTKEVADALNVTILKTQNGETFFNNKYDGKSQIGGVAYGPAINCDSIYVDNVAVRLVTDVDRATIMSVLPEDKRKSVTITTFDGNIVSLSGMDNISATDLAMKQLVELSQNSPYQALSNLERTYVEFIHNTVPSLNFTVSKAVDYVEVFKFDDVALLDVNEETLVVTSKTGAISAKRLSASL